MNPTTATATELAQDLDSVAARRAAAACGAASVPQTTAAESFWRAMSDHSAMWLLTWLASERER